MLKPAILYKDAITKEFQKYFYSEDMFYETGSLENWCPEIQNSPAEGRFQYAIVSHDGKLLGYLDYTVNYYASNVSRFGLISFDRGNPYIGKVVYQEMKRLVQSFHRVEWRMIGGNHAERTYDKFCKRYGGTKHVLKDAVRDRNGNYHDDIIYEIVKPRKE